MAQCLWAMPCLRLGHDTHAACAALPAAPPLGEIRYLQCKVVKSLRPHTQKKKPNQNQKNNPTLNTKKEITFLLVLVCVHMCMCFRADQEVLGQRRARRQEVPAVVVLHTAGTRVLLAPSPRVCPLTPPWLERPGSTEPAPCSRENAASPSAATAGGCLSFLSPLCYWERGAVRGAFFFFLLWLQRRKNRGTAAGCPCGRALPAAPCQQERVGVGTDLLPPPRRALWEPCGCQALRGPPWGLVVGSRGHVACKKVLWFPPPHCRGPAAHSSSARAAKLTAAFSTSQQGPTWSAARSQCHQHLPELSPLCLCSAEHHGCRLHPGFGGIVRFSCVDL